jgi:hypothetical protein
MSKIDTFYKIENANKELWEKFLFGCQLWKTSRDGIYKKFIRATNNEETLKSIGKTPKSIFFKLKRVDFIVIENPRKIKLDNKYLDPYTENLVNNLELNNKEYTILNNGYKNNYFKNSKYRSYTSNIKFLDSAFRKLLVFFLRFSQTCRQYISLISKIYKVDCKNDLLFFISNYFVDYIKFSLIFAMTKPKKIFIVCSYGKEGIIQSARDQNIKVVEMQHGIIGNFHPGYVFGDIYPKHFPDEIWLFGKYWLENTKFPISKFSTYKKLDTSNDAVNKKLKDMQNSILIISQKSARNMIILMTIKLAKKNNMHQFIFKMHPKEYDDYNFFVEKFNKYKNIIVSKADSTEGLIKMSQCMISVDSTSIFEALNEYIPVFLLPDDSNKFFDNLITNKYVKVLKSDVINKELLGGFKQNYKKNYFFE